MSICMCGSQAGYPHSFYCPRPLFRGTTAEEAKWQQVYDENKRSPHPPERY